MAELSWTSEIIYYSECGQDQNWVSITPTQGTSSSSPIVSVKAATSPNDCPRASIIITSNGETQIIPIVRCLPECECKSINFIPNSSLTELSAEGGSVELGTYTDGACVENMQVVTDGIVICEPTIQGGTVTATVQENPSTSPRTGSYKVLLDAEECFSRDNIVQEGKVDPCATAACPTVTPTTMPFESGGGEKTYSFANYDENCWELIGVEKDDWITVNTASTKISVGNYEGTAQRNGTVTFNFVNKSGSSSPCNPSIGITQNKPTPPPVIECDCDSVTGVTETNIPKGGVGSDRFKIAELKITSTCSNKVAITGISDYTGNLGGNPDFEYDDNNVYIKNVSENSDLEAKTFSYKIKYKVTGETVQDCEKDITDAKQNAGDACFYKLDDSAFAITCNTETQKQELEYKIINNDCSKTSESQTFTVTIGGETYSISGKPGDTGKKVVTVNDDTTTVTWHNNGDTSVSGSKEISVGKCETECNIHANVIGHPDGINGVTFRCGGLTNTTGDFSLPSTETGGTISCEKDGFTFKPKDGVVVECGETGQFTVYKDLKITPSITRFNEDSYTLSVPSYEDNLNITLTISVLYNQPGIGPQNYQEDIGAYFGEVKDEDISVPIGSHVTNVVIDKVIFDETGESSETVDNSYINYKYN